MNLEEKLKLWVRITGIDPNEEQKRYAIYLDGRLSGYDIQRMDEKIRTALAYDQTGLFAEAYLSHFFSEYTRGKNIGLQEYLENQDTEEYLSDVKALHAALQDGNAEDIIMAETAKAMNFYGLSYDQLSAFDIAEIRTCAKNCMEKNLHLMQFCSGKLGSEGFKMSRGIYMYRDLNALITMAAQGKIDGVSMAYIRDAEEITYSYFCFVIKNGENLYLLTDKPVFKHPMQSKYKRTPGRDMSRRIEGNLFPYGTVANINVSDLWYSGRYGTTETSTTLAETDDPCKTIGTINDLSQEEALWFVIMLDMIKEKFYNEVPSLPISYTGIQIRHPAIEANETALAVQKALPVLELDRIRLHDTENLKYKRENKNDWNQYLIDRYKDVVTDDLLNITEEVPVIEDKNTSWGRTTPDVTLQAFNIEAACGTEEEIKYTQRWLGRYNYAAAIKNRLQQDYNEHAAEIFEWVWTKITERLETIIKMHLRGELTENKAISPNTFDNVYEVEKTKCSDVATFNLWWNSGKYGHHIFGQPKYKFNKADYRCALTGDAPGVVVTIRPKTAATLALLCGCSIDELPEQIRHWGWNKHIYVGNPILDNVDPVSYLLENDPFNCMNFSCSIILSKKEYLRLCTGAGVKAEKFWLTATPECFKPNHDGICEGRRRWSSAECKYETMKKCSTCEHFLKKMS